MRLDKVLVPQGAGPGARGHDPEPELHGSPTPLSKAEPGHRPRAAASAPSSHRGQELPAASSHTLNARLSLRASLPGHTRRCPSQGSQEAGASAATGFSSAGLASKPGALFLETGITELAQRASHVETQRVCGQKPFATAGIPSSEVPLGHVTLGTLWHCQHSVVSWEWGGRRPKEEGGRTQDADASPPSTQTSQAPGCPHGAQHWGWGHKSCHSLPWWGGDRWHCHWQHFLSPCLRSI